jgi:hypothetical protein
MGIGIALFLTFIAGVATSFGNDAPTGRGGTGHGSPFLPMMSAAYLVAGIVGGLQYFLLQGRAHRYSGKLVLCFFFGILFYGSIGLANALAYQYLGLNFMGPRTVEATWNDLPWVTLGCATIAALVGPVIWTMKSGEKLEW